MLARNYVLVFFFLADENDRSSYPSGQSGCGSGDDRRRKYVAIYHRSRDVCTCESFSKFNTIIQARPSTIEIIYSFIEFQVSHILGLVNFDFSFVGSLLTCCRYICLKSPLPLLLEILSYATVTKSNLMM